jgi:hypothetical protein
MIGSGQWRNWHIPSMARTVDAPADHDLAGCRKQPIYEAVEELIFGISNAWSNRRKGFPIKILN